MALTVVDGFRSVLTAKTLLLMTVFAVFVIGIIDYSLITEKNGCEMTFMFQFPQFILIPFTHRLSQKYPNYNLYAYGEGYYAQSLRDGDFDGVPVVFVPGNRGSYKQVRSLGSVALRMSDKYSTFHFNYFTVDLNEEYSGVNSIQLQSQTQFLKECIIKIVDLYDQRGRNVTLVLIGHSIGGVIIRSVLSLPEVEPYLKNIDLIITLATPHKSPVVPIDIQMTRFYKLAEEFWDQNRDNSLRHINLISIGGGFNDKLVRSDLTRLNNNYSNDLTIVTTAIDDVWVSTDHLCIVWCKQLVLKLTRLLFDLIDKKSLKMFENYSDRNRIIRYHLLERTLEKNYPNFVIPNTINLTPNGEWSENFERIIKLKKPKVLNQMNILLPLIRRETIVIQFKGYYRHNWLMACSPTKLNNNITYCEKGHLLHTYVKRMPSKPHDIERRVYKGLSSLLLNKGYTHLLLAISSSVEPIDIQIDRFTTSIRSKTIIMPNLMQSLTMVFSPITIMDIAVSEETTFYNLSLSGLNHIWHTYWIQMETISCYTSASNIGYLYFSIPWNKESQYQYILPKRRSSTQMTLKLNSPKPKDFKSLINPTLYILVDPNCSYKLHLKPSISEIIGQILRHYGLILLPMIVSIVISMLSTQIIPNKQISSTNGDIHNNKFFNNIPKYLYIQSIEIIKQYRLVSINGLLILSPSSLALYFNYSEMNSMTSCLMWYQLIILYLFLYSTALSIIFVFFSIMTLIFISLSSLVVYLKSRFTVSLNKSNISQEKSFKIKLIPLLSLFVIILIGIIYNSALALLVTLLLHNIQLIHLCIKCQSIERRLGVGSDVCLWNLHLTLLGLLYLSTIPSIPLLLDWINLKLPVLYFVWSDPYLIPGLISMISFPVIWHQYSVININNNQRNYLSIMLKAMAILASIICQFNYLNISIIISVSLLLLSIQHFVELFANRNLKCD
ncbi:GPI inositol-deacylase-like isoform X2 [Oppia nitens]|uniref:GPI inositol-deacylase-like isoform X2 n=1 Tax=Oppia nitens TaxID=1686743 RepID=UPI0023DAA71A|nr:GPI inositol-deacylase-like isoform X2 [Oppia nitens]